MRSLGAILAFFGLELPRVDIRAPAFPRARRRRPGRTKTYYGPRARYRRRPDPAGLAHAGNRRALAAAEAARLGPRRKAAALAARNRRVMRFADGIFAELRGGAS